MEIQTVIYHKVFNLGNYSNEKIGIEMKLQPGENPIDAFAEAKKIVEKSHKFFQDLPTYEMAKKVRENADDHTGREMKASLEIISAFEANYPDYLAKFMPSSRTLEIGKGDPDFEDMQF